VPELLRSSADTLQRFDLRAVLDITLIAAVVYWLLLWLRGTSAMSLLRGVAIVAAVCLALGNLFDLTVVNWLLRNSFTALLVAIPIIFQPELRRALERVGRTRMRTWRSRAPQEGLPTAITESARQCSDLRHGALVVLEGETGLQDYVDTGVRLDALPSAALIVAIFYANSPLHDGAVVIREGRIAAAHCTLPLAEVAEGTHLGTRHRAALGISERTDAIAVVVSEETGEISLASNGRLLRPLDPARLLGFLEGDSGSALPLLKGTDAPAPFVSEPVPVEGAVAHQ
jgi:diadenylate cyclase